MAEASAAAGLASGAMYDARIDDFNHNRPHRGIGKPHVARGPIKTEALTI
jgi:hypothetical protein